MHLIKVVVCTTNKFVLWYFPFVIIIAWMTMCVMITVYCIMLGYIVSVWNVCFSE